MRSFKALLTILLLTTPAWAARDRATDTDDPFAKGMALSAQKKYLEANTYFDQAIKEDPNYIAAYIESARTFVMSGKRREGLKRIEAGLAVAKKKSDIQRLHDQRRLLSEIFFTNATFQHYQDGLNLMKGMKLRAAIEAFEQTLATEPDNVEVMIAYARAQQAVDDWKESINVLEQAFALNPDKMEARILLATAMLTSNHERTIQLLKPLVESPNASEEVLVIYAQALMKRNEPKLAVSILQKDVDHHTDRIRSLFWLGKIYSDSPENRWVARKHLQTFLKRSDRERDAEDIKSLQQDARRIVERINAELDIESAEGGKDGG